MTLNRRLLIGLIPLLAICAAIGIYAIFLFSRLGGSIDVIMRENYRSVLAAEQMKEASAQMNAGLLFALAGDEKRGRDLFGQNLEHFSEGVKIELNNVTLPGERELADRITILQADYEQEAKTFFAASPNSVDRRSQYFSTLWPLFQQVNETANAIASINQANMVDANEEARRQSRNSSQLMTVAMLTAMATAISASYLLARSIAKPLHDLQESAEALGNGNMDQVVAVNSPDEIGRLAATFNKMAAKLRAYRQSTTAQIMEAQQTTENALRAFPDPIFVLDNKGLVKLMNRAGEHFINRIGGDLQTLPALPQHIEQTLRGGADVLPTSFDKVIPLSNGDGETYMLPRVLAIRDEAGLVNGVVVALQDVTKLRVADDIKTNLIATVSHELKTPLTSMQMAVYLLLEERVGPLTAKQTELLLTARRNSDRLLEMIEELLDLARFEGGAALVDKKPMAVNALVNGVLDKERANLASQGFNVAVEVAPHLPEVSVNRARIHQVFANLLSNAAKYSPRGGTIKISAQSSGGTAVKFAVTDQGMGIPKDEQRRVFEKFYRVSESDQEGAGLGLAIAREIVLAHGGAIGLASEPGHGSEFYFTLPTNPTSTQL